MNTYAFLHAAEHAAARHLRRKGLPFEAECVAIAYRGENGIHTLLESKAQVIQSRPLTCLRELRNRIELITLEIAANVARKAAR